MQMIRNFAGNVQGEQVKPENKAKGQHGLLAES
jgi:hypothetical protein